jgi:L-ascorbate metabolism protein UlaG (beta-lactamase superfamily)
MGEVDLLMIPVGGGPTIGARDAVSITRRLSPRWVVPMHYRTPRIGFLETAEEFLAGFEHVHRGERSSIDIDELPTVEGPLAVVPAAP